MLRRRLPWLAALAAVVCLSIPSPANAQIGGFIKKKVKSAVKGESTEQKQAPADAQGQSEPRFSEYVLELNAANLDKLEQGLALERTYTDSVNAAYAKLPTREQFQQCIVGTFRDPEVQKITANMNDMAAMQQAQEKLVAYREKKCGQDPERMIEGKRLALSQGSDRAAEAVGLKPAAYAIMKERLTPFCASGGQAKVKGDMEGMYYVYTAGEIAALQPRCVKLTALLAPRPAAAKAAPGSTTTKPAARRARP